MDVPYQEVITKDNVTVKVNAVVYFRVVEPEFSVVKVLDHIRATSQVSGVKVSVVEIKEVELPETMKRSMAAQAEAERERRAKIIHAEGELQASEKLAQAGAIIAKEPTTLQLRYLQTLTEVASERNSTLIFPLPIDLISMFMNRGAPRNSSGEDTTK